MYNMVSAKVAAELDDKEVSVRDFLASDWTDHVYLVPADRKERKFVSYVQLTSTREDSEKILHEKYINHNGIYIDREKDFGDSIVAHWIYFGVIVSPEEFDKAAKDEFERMFGGK